MKVTVWTKTKEGKETRAIFYANVIKKEYKNSIAFINSNGERITIRKADIISIEK